jgi:uncharacterized protein
MSSIEYLLALQEWDIRYLNVERQLANLPSEYALLEKGREEAKQKIAASQKKLQEMEVHKRQLEGSLESMDVQLVKYKTQQMDIRKQEEYTAMESTIAQLKESMDHIEYEELDLMCQIDEQKKLSAATKAEQELRLQALVEENKLLDHKKQVLEGEVVQLQGKVQEFRQKVAPNWLTAYDQAKAMVKRAPFVVTLDNQRCNGCFMKVPMGTIKLAMNLDEPHFCDSCGRLIYTL